MSDIFDRIKPCNMSRDFVFVSYSKKDKDIVYPLVVKLQERGCNIWIDKELKRAIGINWQKSALDAIADEKCIAILFMTSKSSLTSAPVFAELVWARRGKKVRRNSLSGGPKRIIPINVDEKWSPSIKGISNWIKEEVRFDKTELEESDYNCLHDIDKSIDQYYNPESNNRLERKGEIAQVIYDELLEELGGNNITFANADDIQTILDNVESTVYVEEPSDLEAASRVEKSDTTKNTEAEAPEISVNPASEAVSCAEKNDFTVDSDANESETSDHSEAGNDKKKKSFTVTGDVTYTLYGKEYTENQSTMMLRVFAQVLKRHEEIVPTLCNYKGMNCVSKINYELKENREDMPSYFRVCKYFTYSTGSICVGTAYSFADKCKKIALLLNICGESNDILVSDQIELPAIKTKSVLSDNENSETAVRGNSITFTVFGESFTTNQTDMMKIICKKILEKHPEKLEQASKETLFVSLTDYRDIPKEERPTYFRAVGECEIDGRLVSVGTSFNKQSKINEIGKLLELCGENGSVTIEGETVSSGKKGKLRSSNDIDFFD